jgi:hypothetical protein
VALVPASSHAGSPAGLSSGIVYQTGAGSPVDSVTPSQKGAFYQDLTNGGLYLARGTTVLDWVVVGPVSGNLGEATGVAVETNRHISILAGERDSTSSTAYFGDAYSQWNGHGQGLGWERLGAEGNERAYVKTGATGQHVGVLQDGNGDMSVPGDVTAGGDVTADAVNADTLTGSAGSIALSNGVVAVATNIDLNATGGVFVMRADSAGFFGAAPAAKPTGVAVTAAAIHAALVTLGLIAA